MTGVVVGSGFGGSVSALRLAQKGYRVAVIESGSRFADQEFANETRDVRRYNWIPQLGLRGIMRLTIFKDVFVLSGAVWAAAASVTPTRFTDPGRTFTRTRSGLSSEIGRRSSATSTQKPSGCSSGASMTETAWQTCCSRNLPSRLDALTRISGLPSEFFLGEAGPHSPDRTSEVMAPIARMLALWPMHDRLPARGQEHPG